ncbi:hypothetical protein [Yoonia sp. 2307UL14-13]|uniref:hypothetical protein n=1 Tax=Yoonia sp. 2307UL14-13 TaxID=3126506 RepID=UPI0030A590E2
MRFVYWLTFGVLALWFISPLRRPTLLLVTGAAYPTSWRVLQATAVLGGFVTALVAERRLGHAAFMCAAPVIAVGLICLTADSQRRSAIAAFQPDRVSQNSILWSLRNTPRDDQFHLHAVLMKGCRFYRWSYRDMAPYLLQENAVRNVVPSEWITTCQVD